MSYIMRGMDVLTVEISRPWDNPGGFQRSILG